MKSTSDIMVKDSGTKWKQIESHVDRTQPYYSNKNIDVHRKGGNLDGHLEDYKKMTHEQFLPYLEAYNQKCLKQRKKSRMYGIMKKNGKGYRKNHNPVDDYLRHSKRRNERMVIFYLGNKNIRKRYYHVLRGKYGLTTEKIRDMENRSLVHTAYIWNTLNPYLKVTDYATNTDEKTAHIHTRMLVTGLYGKKRDMATASEKRKGIHRYIRKPSMSFNKALVKTYPSASNSHGRVDSRQAMKAMRKKFDPIIIQSFNHELAKNGYDVRLDLTRTGKANHFTLKEYQAHKDMKRYYTKLAKKIQSAVPKMTHGGKPATFTNYYNLATGKEYFTAGSYSASGADVLALVNSQSLASGKTSIVANYKSSAINAAQPTIANQVSESTSDIEDSANSSASVSASQSVSSVVDSLNTSNQQWQRSLMASLSDSASASAKSKAKDVVAVSVASLSSESSSVSEASKSLVATEAQEIKRYMPLYIHGSEVTDSQYADYARSGATIAHDGSYTATELISAGISQTASQSASNAVKDSSESLSATHSSMRSMIDTFNCNVQNNGNDKEFWRKMPDDEAISTLSHVIGGVRKTRNSTRSVMADFMAKYTPTPSISGETGADKYSYYSDNSLFKHFKHAVHNFSTWADKVKAKLHRYHLHLKHLFKRFMPEKTDKDLNGFATGRLVLTRHPKETQEEILFRLEDEHACDLTKQAQSMNQKTFNDNQNYHNPPITHQPSDDDGLDGP